MKKMHDMKNIDLDYVDEFHMHEVLDRTALLIDMIDSYLMEHPAMKPKWKKLAFKAQDKLNQIYYECSEEHLK